MKSPTFDIVIRELNPGVEHASIRLDDREVAYCFLSDDGLLVFVSLAVQFYPPPPGLAEAVGQLVIGHCIATQRPADGGRSS